jgi:hypothetical protein
MVEVMDTETRCSVACALAMDLATDVGARLVTGVAEMTDGFRLMLQNQPHGDGIWKYGFRAFSGGWHAPFGDGAHTPSGGFGFGFSKLYGRYGDGVCSDGEGCGGGGSVSERSVGGMDDL